MLKWPQRQTTCVDGLSCCVLAYARYHLCQAVVQLHLPDEACSAVQH